LVREHGVNVLSCESQNPSASLTKQEHYGDVKGVAQKIIELSSVEDEVPGDINQENEPWKVEASVGIKAESTEEACEGESATLRQIGLLNTSQLLICSGQSP
jgi:hypothetical protein